MNDKIDSIDAIDVDSLKHIFDDIVATCSTKVINPSYVIKDAPIKGVMLAVRTQKSFDFKGGEEEIKLELIKMLAQEIYKRKLVEFTRMNDLFNDNVVFSARIFVTPDDQVRLMRLNGYK